MRQVQTKANTYHMKTASKKAAKKTASKPAKKESGGFKKLDQIAVIEVDETSTIQLHRVSVNGELRLDIRKYIETERYTGHTREGIALNAEQLRELADHLDGFELESKPAAKKSSVKVPAKKTRVVRRR